MMQILTQKLKLIRRDKFSQIKFETPGKGVPRESASDAQQAAQTARRLGVGRRTGIGYHDPLGIDPIDQRGEIPLAGCNEIIDLPGQFGPIHRGEIVVAAVPGQHDVGVNLDRSGRDGVDQVGGEERLRRRCRGTPARRRPRLLHATHGDRQQRTHLRARRRALFVPVALAATAPARRPRTPARQRCPTMLTTCSTIVVCPREPDRPSGTAFMSLLPAMPERCAASQHHAG